MKPVQYDIREGVDIIIELMHLEVTLGEVIYGEVTIPLNFNYGNQTL